MNGVNIKGKGVIQGPSDFIDGQAVTLKAVPAEGYAFKGWTIGDAFYTANPLTFTVGPEEVCAEFYISVATYLRGMVGFELDSKVLLSIHIRRGVDPDTDVLAVSKRALDLALADIYMWRVTGPSAMTGAEDSDGGWRHKDSGWELNESEKRTLIQFANSLYTKYGEKPQGSVIRIINL